MAGYIISHLSEEIYLIIDTDYQCIHIRRTLLEMFEAVELNPCSNFSL